MAGPACRRRGTGAAEVPEPRASLVPGRWGWGVLHCHAAVRDRAVLNPEGRSLSRLDAVADPGATLGGEATSCPCGNVTVGLATSSNPISWLQMPTD